MAKELRLLNQVHVAAPCPASWDEMKGDNQVRHCSMCRHNVYNLSEMTAEAAEKLIREKEGRLCVRYYQREDGKVLTKDCPRGLRALRQRAVKRFALAASFALTAIGCGEQGEKVKTAFGIDKFYPAPVTVGKIAVPTPPPTTGAVAIPITKGSKCVPPPTTKGKTTVETNQVSIRMGEISSKEK